MFELKSITKPSIPKALERAERYRLLNEPREAQSICLDVLEIDPDNRAALQTLLLALTDQFPCGAGRLMEQAKQLLPRLGAYEQKYYGGIIMELYDEAHELAPEGNDEAILRHNTCVRTIVWHQLVEPMSDEQELPLE